MDDLLKSKSGLEEKAAPEAIRMRMRIQDLFIAGALAIVVAAGALRAGQAARPGRSATVIAVQRVAHVWRGQGHRPAELGQALYQADRLTTGEHGILRMMLTDGSTFTLGHNTDMTLRTLGGRGAAGTFLRLVRGMVDAVVTKMDPGQHQWIETPTGVTAVKGTQYRVEALPGRTELRVLKGLVELSAPGGKGSLDVGAGELAESYADRVGRLRKLNRNEIEDLRRSFHATVEDAKKSYQDRVNALIHKHAINP